MFNLNPNHKRHEKPNLAAFPECHFDYAKEYQVRDGYYEGEIVDAVTVYAESQMVNTKNGPREDLTVILIDNDNKRFKARFHGALHRPDGTESDLSDRTYDFVKMASRQKNRNINEFTTTYESFGAQKTIYPMLCGIKTRAVVATTGTYRGYAKNDAELFNPDGRSEEEFEKGAAQPNKILSALATLKARYQKFASENTSPQPVSYGSSSTAEIRPSANASVDDEDDIPF